MHKKHRENLMDMHEFINK